MTANDFQEFDREKEKLYSLLAEAMGNGTLIYKSKAIIQQSEKIDLLILKLQVVNKVKLNF